MAEITTDTYYVYDCPYRGKCSDEGVKCDSCYYNTKKSYYTPAIPDYPTYPTPCWPDYPYYPYTTTWGVQAGDIP